jgi:hypothetical protein
MHNVCVVLKSEYPSVMKLEIALLFLFLTINDNNIIYQDL